MKKKKWLDHILYDHKTDTYGHVKMHVQCTFVIGMIYFLRVNRSVRVEYSSDDIRYEIYEPITYFTKHPNHLRRCFVRRHCENIQIQVSVRVPTYRVETLANVRQKNQSKQQCSVRVVQHPRAVHNNTPVVVHHTLRRLRFHVFRRISRTTAHTISLTSIITKTKWKKTKKTSTTTGPASPASDPKCVYATCSWIHLWASLAAPHAARLIGTRRAYVD